MTLFGHFLKASKPSHGLDVQTVTWIGRHNCNCPIRHGFDTLQIVTYVCHGLDSHPGQSRIGRPICDWDWTHFKIIQTKHGLDVQFMTWIEHPIRDSRVSRIGCPIRDWDWMILKCVQSQSQIGRPIRDWPG